MQKERLKKPFFPACLRAALTATAIGLGALLLLCALCLLSDDPASVAGYGANAALLLTAFLAGLFCERSLYTADDSITQPLLRGLCAGALVFCLCLGLSLLVPSDQSGRLTHLLTTLPIYALCTLGMGIVGSQVGVTRHHRKRSVRAARHKRASKGALKRR